MLDFDKLEQEYQASKKGDVLEPKPIIPEIDVDSLEREYQMSRPLSEQNPKASFQDYPDTRDAEMVGEPRPDDTSGLVTQAAVTDKLKDIGATGAFLATSALEGAVHPLFAPLEGTPFDTNKLIADAVEYWRARTPAGFTVHDLGVTISKKPVKGEIASIGPVRLVPVKYSARELAGQVAEGTGFAVPAGTAMTAGRLVSRAAGLTGAAERIAGGVVGGALLGEGDPKKTAETAAMFGLFEAIPALGSVIKSKVQRAKLMREWRRLPEEQKVPVIQSLAETLRKNPEMSEAEAVRMSREWFKEAQQRRVTPEQPAPVEKPVPEKKPLADVEDIWGPVDEWVSPEPAISGSPAELPGSYGAVKIPQFPVKITKAAPRSPAQLPAPIPQFPKDRSVPVSQATINQLEQEFQAAKNANMPSVDEAIAANTEEDRRAMLARIFNLTPEEMRAIDEEPFVELSDPVKDALTMDYMADLDHAIKTRNRDDVEEILRRIKNKEYVDGPPDSDRPAEVSVKQKIPDKEVSDTLKQQKQYLLDSLTTLEQQLKSGAIKGQTHVTIPLEGGTEFSVVASVDAIRKLRNRIKRGLSPVLRKKQNKTTVPLRRNTLRISGNIGYKMPFRPVRAKRFTKKEFGDVLIKGNGFIGNGAFIVTPEIGRKLLPGKLNLPVNYRNQTINDVITGKFVKVTPTYVVKTPEMRQALIVVEGDNVQKAFFSEIFDRIYSAAKPDELLVNKETGAMVFNKNGKRVGIMMPTDLPDETIKTYLTKEPIKAYRAKDGVDPIKIQHIVELPEVIELTRGFMNKDPRIVQRFRDFGVLGSFRPGKDPEIKLRRDLAENPELAARVLAHELGHAEDFNFETMSRGNLLGRIAKLRVYLKKQLAEKPGAPGPLTEKEKAILREEARKIRQQEIDKAIGDELGFTPEEVLNFLRGIDTRDLPKEVKDFIAKADTQTKKSIVKQAMKGLSPEELKHLRKAPRGIGKTIEEHFKELLKKEVERRKLWELEEIKEELREFSKQWRPWDEGQDVGYDKYRNSPEELYADAVSGLILAPDSLQKIAPKFYKAFENYLETRPAFAENYRKIMNRITAGPEEVSRHRIKQTYKDFAAEAEKAKEREKTRLELKKKEEEKTVDTLLRGLNTSDHPILKFVKVAEKGDVLGKRKARIIREMLLKRPYTPSEIDAYAYDFKQWYDAVHEAGLTVDDLGALGKRLHIVYNRKNIFSSHGLTPKTAAKDIAVLARDWGPEKYNKARRFLNEYRKLREKHIIPLLRKSGLITPNMAETIKRRKFYLRVLSQDWLKADQWPGMKQFYRQVGTISRQQNPIVSTFLDDIAAIYASRENILRRAVYRFMAEIGAGRKAIMKYSPTEKRMVVNKRALKHREKVARVKVDGKYQYYFMLDNIVDALEKDSFKQYQMLRLWQTMGQIFRELYVGSNPQWMLRNMPRDFLETVFKNPDVVGLKGIGKLLKAYWETAPDVFKEAWRNERSALIQDMMRRRTLPTNRIWGSFEETPANEIERTLSRYNLYKLTDSQKKLYNKFVRRFFENQTAEQIADEIEAFARGVWDKKERLGRASDLWGKVAARKFFEKYTDLPPNEIDMRVIEQAGTPNYKNRGAWQIITNNLFMFSTVAKEGLKADIRALRRSPLAWLSTMAALTVLPAVMNWMADEGHMGKEIKRIFNRIPKYYKDHYFVIPLFVDNNGKAHFLAFPTGYNQQVLKATFSKLLRGEFGGAGGAVSEMTGISPYSVHPLIGKLTAFALYYLYGVNPPNLHYGTNIIAPSDYDVGGKAAAKDLFRDAWNDLTGGWLYRAKGPYESQRKSKAEKFLTRFPGNILGTFYKISDGGIGERIRDRLTEMRKEAKRRNLSIREYRLRIAKDRNAAIAAAQVLRRVGDKRQARELEKDIARLWGDQWAKAIATAKNNEEREAILQLMMEDEQ